MRVYALPAEEGFQRAHLTYFVNPDHVGEIDSAHVIVVGEGLFKAPLHV